MELSKKDEKQLEKKGISSDKVEDQIQVFKEGTKPVNIQEAATVGKGIGQFSDEERKELAEFYEQQKDSLDIIKFVPASGAATRMFKALHVFTDEFDPEKESLQQYLDRKDEDALTRFIEGMEKLPFYEEAQERAKKEHKDFQEASADKQKKLLAETILYTPGLGLSDYPKGLVPFHKYRDFIASAFEEQLYEAAAYATVDGEARLHFTVSEGLKQDFEEELEKIRARLEEETGIKFSVSYSYQDPKTDTIAVTEENEPFRTEEGALYFRPGGHGALIENLNYQDADLAFIKNIDNVVVRGKVDEMAAYKKMLAGKLLKLQEKCFRALEELEKEDLAVERMREINKFLEQELYSIAPEDFENLSVEEKVEQLRERLNRPLRVCGMVKNEGEPGGGPFLVKGADGEISLQIVESAQIDEDDPEQQKKAGQATHFNPVDIVVGLRDYKGSCFELRDYIDYNTYFIAQKSKDGKKLKALELPGLWNGAMAKWNSVFVEVPLSTFNPVKTVADLLRPTHQSE